MSYSIRYDIRVRDDLRAIAPEICKRILAVIKNKLVEHPSLFGKPLRHSLFGLRVLRVGNYRVVFFIRELVVTVLLIGDRQHVYREAQKRVI